VSVNYVAKSMGVSRDDGLEVARSKVNAKNETLFEMRKDQESGKPEGASLRLASWQILDSIKDYRKQQKLKFKLEYASNDEFYLDLTEDIADTKNKHLLTEESIGKNTHLEAGSQKVKAKSIITKMELIYPKRSAVVYYQEKRLIQAAPILEGLRQFIFRCTGFDASVGIGSNKLIAKLACAEHKPAGVTILPDIGLHRVAKRIPIGKIPTLGGERGLKIIRMFGQKRPLMMADLAQRSVYQLMDKLKCGPGYARDIHRLVNGYDEAPVVEKLMKDSLSVGRSNLRAIKPWISDCDKIRGLLVPLVVELKGRLNEEASRHNRMADKAKVEMMFNGRGMPAKRTKSFSVRLPEIFTDGDVDKVVDDMMDSYQNTFGKIVGMIVKMNFYVKEFHPINRHNIKHIF
jgi:nucleotidyltransferase/DNA polymerase involved in DNA repair